MNLKQGLFALFLLVPCGGCATASGVTVSHHTESEAPVSGYASYHLVVAPHEGATQHHWSIESAIHQDLRAKGYTPVDRAQAELVVSYETDMVAQRARSNSDDLDGSMAEQVTQKHVTITIVDARNGTKVWHSAAVGEVPTSRLTASLDEALVKMMRGVPRRS